jgi:Ser/Thr protein kinase RdoA (MazF antagonist)
MHKISQRWRARLPNRRHHWYEDDLFTEPARFLRVTDVIPRREYEELLQWLLQRKRSTENYGLCHGDFGTGNLRHVNGDVLCFDFDDCSYHWFTYDLAVAMRGARRLPFKYRKAYLRVLMDGYETVKSLCGDTEKDVAQFIRLAALYRFVAVLRMGEREGFDETLKVLFERRLDVLANPTAWS